MNQVHGEDNESEEEIEVDDSDGEDESSEASFSSEEIEDNPTYWEWYQQALRDTQERRDKKYEKYINEGMDEEDAREKAHEKILWLVKRIFFDHYTTYLSQNLHLKDNEIHQEIMDDLEEKTDKGMDVDRSIKKTMVQHKAKFDQLFEYDETEEEEEDEEEEEETEGESETDEETEED